MAGAAAAQVSARLTLLLPWLSVQNAAHVYALQVLSHPRLVDTLNQTIMGCFSCRSRSFARLSKDAGELIELSRVAT